MFMYYIICLDISTLEMISETIILWLIWFIHMSERYDNLEKTRFAWLTKKKWRDEFMRTSRNSTWLNLVQLFTRLKVL